MSQIPAINLLPRPLLERRARVTLFRVWTGALCVVLAGVAVAVFAVHAPGVLKEDATARACASVNDEIAKIESELPGLNASMSVLDRRLLMLDTLEDRPDWGVLLAYLHDQRGDGVTLENCALMWSSGGVLKFSLTGLGDAPGREHTLVTGLEDSGLFSSTTLLGAKREVVGGVDRIVFQIECEFDPALAESPTP